MSRPTRAASSQIRANSVYRALAAVGDRWSLLILGAAFNGCVRFGQWRQAIGIASNVLSNRLTHLVELGCFERQPGDDARGFEYHLTRKGFDLYPVALMFWRFDQLWSEPRLLHPDTLTHGSDEHEMMPVMVCGECGAEVRSRDVRYEDGPGAGTEESPPPRVSRRSSVTLGSSGARHSTLFGESVDRMGDRWTQMVLAALFLGANRFDEIQRECGIAPNILSLRLKELVDGDLLLRRRYQSGPDRFEYVLTPKGLDMYPIALALMTWGDRWMAAEGPPLLLTHSSCGSSLDPAVVCRSCRQVPTPREVAFGSAAA